MFCAAMRRDFYSSSLVTWPLGLSYFLFFFLDPPLYVGHPLASAPKTAGAYKYVR